MKGCGGCLMTLALVAVFLYVVLVVLAGNPW